MIHDNVQASSGSTSDARFGFRLGLAKSYKAKGFANVMTRQQVSSPSMSTMLIDTSESHTYDQS